jgi:SHS family lactate transporter-like MFS transporter
MAAASTFAELKNLTPDQRNVVIASFLGWTLDAFDFFLMTFVLANIAHDFGSTVKDVAYGIALTLAMRPLGAFIFGRLADRFGRRPILMIDILLYTVLELASAFAPSLTVLLLLRALFGVAMGGEWGIGSSLTMESIPPRARGIVSGFLQEGYATGFLLAAIANFLVVPHFGWRGMFVIGAMPAVLVIYIRASVKESPTWEAAHRTPASLFGGIAQNPKLFLLSLVGVLLAAPPVYFAWVRPGFYAGGFPGLWVAAPVLAYIAWLLVTYPGSRLFFYMIAMMACFNAFSHGTQDLYATFLKVQHHFSPGEVSSVLIVANLGAIAGGISFGAFSERIGRRRAIIIAALLSLPMISLWAYSATPAMLAFGAFLMQFMVQGAWGVVPVHLNEMAPEDARGTFPGFTYQLGNFLISLAAPIQAGIAASHGGDYRFALASTVGVVVVLLVIVVGLGKERKGVVFGKT